MRFMVFLVVAVLAVTSARSDDDVTHQSLPTLSEIDTADTHSGIFPNVDTAEIAAAKVVLYDEVKKTAESLNAGPEYLYDFYHNLFQSHPEYDPSSKKTTN
ncbi:hypothetical protein J6590_000867 [Homalodisca vitripennis]|nr:hypothetical protein J6590_000867 [Homalodisca vitripennis]